MAFIKVSTISFKIARSLMTVDIFIAGNNAVSMVLKMTLDEVSDKCISSMLSVRALASHQCGPGLIPDLGVICGLSLLLVLVLAPRGQLTYSCFLLSSKANISNFQSDPESEGHRFVSRN